MRTVILTGASRGLGRALLERLMQASIPVVSIGRSRPDAEGVRHINCDLLSLARADGWAALDTALADLDGDLTFINCAGTVQPIGGLDESAPQALLDSLTVNLTAPLAIARSLTAMVERDGRLLQIINVTSGAAQRAIGGWTAYCAGKAGARMAFDALAATHSGRVSVTHWDPGALDGDMQAEIRGAGGRFPARGTFVRWQAEGVLKQPGDAADELMAILQDMPA
jgi:benzil reductase ((S)-benzoin forming)